MEEELTSAYRDRAACTADVDLQEQLRARANAEHDALVAQHTAAPKGSRIVNESGEDMLALLRGSKFMGPGGELMPVEASVSHGQAHDFVDDARGRRFWVYKSAEEKAAASATSHDCVRGSLLLVRCGPHYLALARVVRLGTLSGGGGGWLKVDVQVAQARAGEQTAMVQARAVCGRGEGGGCCRRGRRWCQCNCCTARSELRLAAPCEQW